MARSKFNAQPTMVDNVRFHSGKEAKRYLELKLLLRAGEIEDLTLQPKFTLSVPSTSGQTLRALKAMAHGGMFPIGEYRADFAYLDHRSGKRVVEDVKGFKTPLYLWKKRHVEIQYGIKVLET